MKTERYLQFAKNLAEMSDVDRQQLGCVVTYKKTIIGVGFNCQKTHPIQKEFNQFRYKTDRTPHSLHAEMHALIPIRHLDIDWSKVKLYIYRLCRCDTNKGLYARPCPSCMAYIKRLGIKNIYYSSFDGPIHEVLDV